MLINLVAARVRKNFAQGHLCCVQGYHDLGSPHQRTRVYLLVHMVQAATGKEWASPACIEQNS